MIRKTSALPRCRTSRPGVAALELAFCLPIVILLAVGVWEVGRMLEVQQLISNAAREGGRQAANGTKTADEVRTAVVTYLTSNGVKKATLEHVTLENVTDASRINPTIANQLDHFRVTVKIPVDDVRWSWLDQLTGVTELVGVADWYSMRDIAIEVSVDIPRQ